MYFCIYYIKRSLYDILWYYNQNICYSDVQLKKYQYNLWIGDGVNENRKLNISNINVHYRVFEIIKDSLRGRVWWMSDEFPNIDLKVWL